MTVILTHVGHEPPLYVEDCIRQLRLFNPDVPISFIGEKQHIGQGRWHEFLIGMRVRPVFVHELASDQKIHDFCQETWFRKRNTPRTTYPSQSGFWHFTIERFFWIELLMRRDALTDVFHFENDVLIYRNLSEVLAGIRRSGRKGMYITPVDPHWVTTGLLFIPGADLLTQFTTFVIEQTSHSEKAIKRALGIPTLCDGPLLKIFGDRSQLLQRFPILPSGPHASDYSSFNSIFDPNSWGQFAGGTNNGHPAGYTAGHHYIGVELRKRNYGLGWEGEECLVPYAVDREGRKARLNNLHIHSKNLRAFRSTPVAGSDPRSQAAPRFYLAPPPLPAAVRFYRAVRKPWNGGLRRLRGLKERLIRHE